MNEDIGFVYKDYVTVDGKEHGYVILRNESEIVVRLTDRTIIVEDPKKVQPFHPNEGDKVIVSKKNSVEVTKYNKDLNGEIIPYLSISHLQFVIDTILQ